MKYQKIFLLLLAIYTISIAAAMVFVSEVFKSAITTYFLSAPLYGALIAYYFYWRSINPVEPIDEIA